MFVISIYRDKISSFLLKRPDGALFLSLAGAFTGIIYALYLLLPVFGTKSGFLLVVTGFIAIIASNKGPVKADKRVAPSINASAVIPFLAGFILVLIKVYWDKTAPLFLGMSFTTRELSSLFLLFFAISGAFCYRFYFKKKLSSPVSYQWLLFAIILSLWQISSTIRTFSEITPVFDHQIKSLSSISYISFKAAQVCLAFGPLGFLFGIIMAHMLRNNITDKKAASGFPFFIFGTASATCVSSFIFIPSLHILTFVILLILLPIIMLTFIFRKECVLRRTLFMALFSFFIIGFIFKSKSLISLQKKERIKEETRSYFFTEKGDPSSHVTLFRNGFPSIATGSLLFQMEHHIGSLCAQTLSKDIKNTVLFLPQTGMIDTSPFPFHQNTHNTDKSLFKVIPNIENDLDLIDVQFFYPLSPYERVYITPSFYKLCKKKLSSDGILHQRIPEDSATPAYFAAKKVFPFVKVFTVSDHRVHLMAGYKPLVANKEIFQKNIKANARLSGICQKLGIRNADDIILIMENSPEIDLTQDGLSLLNSFISY
jgi:hypothetical protein